MTGPECHAFIIHEGKKISEFWHFSKNFLCFLLMIMHFPHLQNHKIHLRCNRENEFMDFAIYGSVFFRTLNAFGTFFKLRHNWISPGKKVYPHKYMTIVQQGIKMLASVREAPRNWLQIIPM